jgi:hypothetical protein
LLSEIVEFSLYFGKDSCYVVLLEQINLLGTLNNYSTNLLCHVDSDQGTNPMQAVSNFSVGNEVNIIAAPRESSLFSSSLSDLFSRKCKFSLQNCMLRFLVKIVG